MALHTREQFGNASLHDAKERRRMGNVYHVITLPDDVHRVLYRLFLSCGLPADLNSICFFQSVFEGDAVRDA